jgi:exosortase
VSSSHNPTIGEVRRLGATHGDGVRDLLSPSRQSTANTMNVDASNDDAVLVSSAQPGFRWSPVDLVGLIAVIAALGWAYKPNLQSLYLTWLNEPDYTHGFLVVPIALWILWNRWPASDELRPTPWLPGWLLIIGALLARVYFHEQGKNWLESSTLLPVIVGLGLARLGWRLMLRVWPAFAFLVFLYPLPPQLNSALSQPLQSLATSCSCILLRLTGLWVMPEGNVILVGNERLEVATACNGLSMLMSLSATVAAAASLIPIANWKRMSLLISIIPIALGSNVLRIAATAWCFYRFGAKVGHDYAHDLAGWLMMPVAMALVALELGIMSWLIVESEEVERTTDRLGLGLVSGNPHPEGPR